MTPLGIIVIWLLVIELKVSIDWWQIVKLKRNIAHGWELGAVIFVYIFYGIYVAQIRSADWWALDVTVFAASAYWLLFRWTSFVAQRTELFLSRQERKV